MKKLILNYTFNAAAKTVTLTDYGSIDLEGVLLITNVVDNVIIYNFSDPLLGGTAATNVITLTYNTATMSNGDELQIFYDDSTATQAITAAALPLPTGAATSALQQTDALTNTQLRASAVPVSMATAPLPTGGATAAKQDTGNVSLASIDGKITAVNTGAVIVASSALPTGASTSALQTTGNTSIASIDTKTPALGQALAAASVPVVLTAAQVTTLTPPAAITNYANETGGNLAAIKAKTDNIPAQGQALAAASLPVVLTAAQITTLTPPAAITGFATETTLGTRLTESDFDTKTGSLTETAPATDTASSGLNGRLQRIAQRITSLIAAVGSPFQAGGSIGNTSFAATQATAANLNATVVGTGTFVTQATLAAETTKVIGTVRTLGNIGAITDGVNTAATAPANGFLGLGIYNSTEPSPTTGQSVGVQLDAKGRQRNVIMDAAGNTRGANVDANNNLGVVLAAETTKVLGVTRTADGAGNLLTSHAPGSAKALDVSIVDGSGNQITSFGGGTQYTEDVASVADPIGTMVMGVRADTLAAVTSTDGDNIAARFTNNGEQYVKTQDNVSVTCGIASNFKANVVGDVASDSADSVNNRPVKIGMRAASFGNGQTDVSDGDMVNATASRSGALLVLGGTSNVLTLRLAITGANTNVAIVTASGSQKIVVTAITVSSAYTNLAFPSVRVGFATATTPTTTGVVFAHDGVCPGSFLIYGSGVGILGVGALDEDLRITNDDPTGTMSLVVSYFITAG